MGIDVHDILDAKSCPDWWVHEYHLDCSCPAKEDPCAKHWWTCTITPMYAGMNLELLSDIYNDVAAANASIDRHIHKCAECGAKRRAEDMVVIYEAPLKQAPPYDTPQYKYPHNIVKVVCCTHNRKGRVGYQGVMPNGY